MNKKIFENVSKIPSNKKTFASTITVDWKKVTVKPKQRKQKIRTYNINTLKNKIC